MNDCAENRRYRRSSMKNVIFSSPFSKGTKIYTLLARVAAEAISYQLSVTDVVVNYYSAGVCFLSSLPQARHGSLCAVFVESYRF